MLYIILYTTLSLMEMELLHPLLTSVQIFDYILQMFLSRDWRSDWTYVLCSRMQERGEGEVPGWEAGDYQGDSGPILSYS